MNTKKTKITAILVILVLALACLAGCGNKGIEGTWVLVEEYEASGKKISSKELQDMGISETYEITGTKVVYTCEMPKSKKPVVINFDLEDLMKIAAEIPEMMAEIVKGVVAKFKPAVYQV